MQQNLGTQHQFFEEIFKKNYSNLCRYAFGFLKDEEACEDLVQDLFIKLWQDKPEIFLDKSVVSYLHTATKNNCISSLRKKIMTISVDDENAPEIVDIDTSEQQNNTELLYGKIFDAIEQLPPKCAATFKMHRLGGLSYKQIADELNVSVKTVENQIGKAMKILRNTLLPEVLGLCLMALVEYQGYLVKIFENIVQ